MIGPAAEIQPSGESTMTGTLAYTGIPADWMFGLAGLLVAAGAGALLLLRLRSRRVQR
jgi:hypothetical protein